MDVSEYEKMLPHMAVDGMLFYTPNRHCAWRVETLYTKEPDTIEWLKSMSAGDVLYDVGANVGLYTVFPAKRGVTVHAFEPESQNFAVLQKNIILNKLTNATAYPISLSNQLKIDTLRLSAFMAGGSCHTFGSDVDYKGEQKQFPAKQGSVSFTGDWLSWTLGVPNHVKIDVDGHEPEVLSGLSRVLPKLKSLLVEINTHCEKHNEWVKNLEQDYGFKWDREQAQRARRTEGAFQGVGNIIFTRA